jgi:hypothetical protein
MSPAESLPTAWEILGQGIVIKGAMAFGDAMNFVVNNLPGVKSSFDAVGSLS